MVKRRTGAQALTEEAATAQAERTIEGERQALALGARCHSCWMRGHRDGGPVLAEVNASAKVLVIGEAPGADEVKLGRSFVGASGRELDVGLLSAGWRRAECAFDNVLACRPPENKLERVIAGWKKENARRLKLGAKDPAPGAPGAPEAPQAPEFVLRARELDDADDLDEALRREAAGAPELLLPHPFDCCRPRLLGTVRRFTDIILAGRTALVGVTGLTRGILDSRGGPIEGYFDQTAAGRFFELARLPNADRNVLAELPPGVGDVHQVRLLPTVHPSLVLHNRSWTRAFRSDLAKARRWFTGRLGWADPKITFQPTVEQLEAFLFGGAPFYSWDVETEWKKDDPRTHSPLLSRLRCIGVSTKDEAMVVPLLGIDGQTRFYSARDEERLRALFTRWFTDRGIVKVGWNCLFKDVRVPFASGGSATIERIVRTRCRKRVLAMRSGRIVEARVSGWHKIKRAAQPWVSIAVEGMKVWGRGLRLTPDHQVFTSRGLVTADAVQAGDVVYLPEPRLGQMQTAAIVGTVLGDSQLTISDTRKAWAPGDIPTAKLRCDHTTASRLVRRKIAFLRGVLVPHKGGINGMGGAMDCATTPMMRQLGVLRPWFYGNRNRRIIAPEVLAVLDGPQGDIALAWWFMDDGNRVARRDRYREPIALALCRYAQADRQAVAELLWRRFGPVTVYSTGTIGFSLAATGAFCQAVGAYVFPEMRYKLPQWTKAPPWQRLYPPSAYEPLAVRVVRVGVYSPPKRHDTSYCITTSEGNFFTNYGLVKNCGYYDALVVYAWLGVEVL